MTTEYRLVLNASGRRFGIRLDAGEWIDDAREGSGFVVDDIDEGVELGPASATCTPLLVWIDGQQHILFAGTCDVAQQKFVSVDDHPYPVHDGVWMSFPEPFTPGRVVTVVGLDMDEDELFRLTSPPLEIDSLAPMFGPSWTGY